MMSPRRQVLPLLSVLALLLAPFALAPRAAEAQGSQYIVDRPDDVEVPGGCTNPLDNDDCTLRQALLLANGDPGASNITFDASLSGSVIALADVNNPLPALTASNTTISGAAGDQSGTPNIAINGNGSTFNGLTITGSGNLVASLSIYGFVCSSQGAGAIVVQNATATSNRIERNYIGLTLDGGAPAVRNCNGVVVRNGASGTRVQNFNVIGANQFDGVLIQNASDNLVLGNRIGLSPDSTQTARGNLQNGVHVLSGPGDNTLRNVVGSATVNTDRNVIGTNGTGAGFAGIRIAGSGTLTTTVAGNVVGLNSAGTQDRGNTGDGIFVGSGARATSIQGTTGSALVVSGNDGYGIRVTGSGTRNTTITGVYVGTTGSGTGVIGNSLDGIRVDAGAANTTITGGTSTNRTLIAGNGGRGVVIDGAATTGVRVENSLVGVVIAATSSAPQPNALGGVLVNGAVRATIAGNTLSGNAAYGLRLNGTDTVTVTGNFVGLSLDRKAAQGNSGPGVQLWNARNTQVGGPPASSNSPVNFVAGNLGAGVVISGTGSVSVTLQSNQIGLVQEAATLNFLARGANAGEGVLITSGARRVTLDGNTVAGSADTADPDFTGISVRGDGSSGPGGALSSTNVATVTLASNRVGWMPSSTAANAPLLPFPNGDGIAVSGRAQNVALLLNSVRLNAAAGVRLTNAISVTLQENGPLARNAAGGVVVEGASRRLTLVANQIVENGRDVNGAVVKANADGLLFNNSGPEALSGAQVLSNTLRANTGRGIALQGNVQRVTMRFNRLALNGGPIRLVGATRYPGSGADPDTLATPNHGIDGPIVDVSFANPLALRVNQAGFIEGYVYTNTGTIRPIAGEASISPASACITCTIQLFRPDRTVPPEDQGWELIRTLPEIGATTARDFITVGANGRFAARMQDTLPSRLLLIATDGFGNSSEYATMPLTASLVLEPVAPPSLAQSAAPGDTVTYTLRLRNTGTLGYSNLRLQTGGTLARWRLTSVPTITDTFGLNAGATRLVTVTLRLPTGSDRNVAAGVKDTTRITITGGPPPVTATARLETTVLPRPVISITPRSSLGSGRPQTVVPHAFNIANNGNVTVTLNLAFRTVDPANSPGTWSTNINTSTLRLGPGQSSRVGVSVTVPAGALQNVAATTFLTATVQPGTPPGPVFPGQTIPFSATTRADLNPNADLFPDVETEGAAGGQVPLVHTVENKSNGTATFCLDYFTSSRTTVRFESATNGFVVNAQGCFTLYAGADINPSQGRFGIAQIRAIATIDRRLTSGDVDRVTIFLRKGSPTGESISDATVEDKIRVTVGEKLPRLWLPLVRQNQPRP
jgi:hypothetical protein